MGSVETQAQCRVRFFVDEGIGSALSQVWEAAGDRDVCVTVAGVTILQYLNAGLVDEFLIALVLVLFGSGTRLFEGVDESELRLEAVSAEPSSRVTRLIYTVHPR